MRSYKFRPKFRNDTVEVVTNPTDDWFDNIVNLRHNLRFTVLQDGSVWFGDSTNVTHGDIMALGSEILREEQGNGIIAGVILFGERSFAACRGHEVTLRPVSVVSLQYFGGTPKLAVDMLYNLIGWRRFAVVYLIGATVAFPNIGIER